MVGAALGLLHPGLELPSPDLASCLEHRFCRGNHGVLKPGAVGCE